MNRNDNPSSQTGNEWPYFRLGMMGEDEENGFGRLYMYKDGRKHDSLRFLGYGVRSWG